MRANLKSTILAVLGIASLAIAVPMTIANAQDAGQRGGQQRGGFGAGAQPPQRGGGDMQGMMQRMGGGGGGTAMTQDAGFLYIVQGNQVFKLNKRDLEVVATGRLPGGPGGPGGQGGFGGGQGGRGGAGGAGGGLPGDPIPPIE